MEINKLSKYFSELNILTMSEIEAVCNGFEFVKLKKDGFFVEENIICNKIGFIINGGVKAFSTDSIGNENITCFKFEKSFITSYESFAFRKVSKKTIQAIEDCEILTIVYGRFKALLEKIPSLQLISKLLMEQEFMEKENYMVSFNNKSAKEKYTYLLSHMPEIIKRAKTKDISSYLGITQRTLTRTKNAIMQSPTF